MLRKLIGGILTAAFLTPGLMADAMDDRMKVSFIKAEIPTALKMGDYARARASVIEAIALAPRDPKLKAWYDDLAGPETAILTDEEIFFVKDVPEFKFKVGVLTNPPSAGAAWVKGVKVFIKRGDDVIRTLDYKGLSEPMSWDGRTGQGEVAADGVYQIFADIKGKLGFSIPAKENRLMLVSKKLEAMIAVKEKLFAAGKETVHIGTIYPDRTRVTAWELTIVNTAGKTVKKLAGTTLPEAIEWNGKDEAGEAVAPGDIYSMTLKGKDKGGKSFEANVDSAESEIPIIDIGNSQLSFKMNTLQFAIGKADVNTNSFVLLDRVAAILKKYGWYSVKVQGHTDNVGGAADNQALSQKRAEAVSAYLAGRDGKLKDRLSSEGIGMGKPIADNATESGRAKNRRVEFVLTKIPLKE